MAKKQLGFTDETLYLSILPGDLKNELLVYLGTDIRIKVTGVFHDIEVSLGNTKWIVSCQQSIANFISFLNSNDKSISFDDDERLEFKEELPIGFSRFGIRGSYHEHSHYCILVFYKNDSSNELYLDVQYSTIMYCRAITYTYIESMLLQYKLEQYQAEYHKYWDFVDKLRMKF